MKIITLLLKGVTGGRANKKMRCFSQFLSQVILRLCKWSKSSIHQLEIRRKESTTWCSFKVDEMRSSRVVDEIYRVVDEI
jgi:hypothetical protein